VSFVATATSSRVREIADGRLPAAALGIAVAPVLAAQGGYFPTSWGWSGLLLAWAAVMGALLRPISRPSRLELLFVGGLAAFAAWQAASSIWGPATAAGLEVERTFVYVAAALALLTLVGREHVRFLLAGVLGGVAIVCIYALLTRLFPNGFNSVNTWSGARLSTPVGYWNGLGIVAGIGVLLALGFAARSAAPVARAASGAAVPLLVTTLYFTFSRGAWLSTFAGLVVLFAVDRSRIRLAVVTAPLAVVAGLAVLDASRSSALTHVGRSLAAATHDGHRVAAVVLLAVIVSAYVAYAAGKVRTLPRRLERAVPWAALALVAVAVVAVLVRFGAPWTIARHGYDSFTSKQAASTEVNLNSRLFSLSNNGRLHAWRVAIHAFEAHPLGGIGAGGFEQYWNQHRPAAETLRDAHSLYLETLAETGIVGMLILGAALLAPLAAFRRAREEPFAAFALAGYVAFLVEATVDWDWELSGVTLVGLLCGGALLAAARGEKPVGRWRLLPIALGSVAGLLALGGLIGNLSLSSSAKAAHTGHWSAAASDARRARFFAPWSAQPWEALGHAQLGLGQKANALASYRKAVAKDPQNAQLWVELAQVEHGPARWKAFSRAITLDPLDDSIRQTVQQLLAAGAKP
jgi:hypothetical protein